LVGHEPVSAAEMMSLSLELAGDADIGHLAAR
jgi:hypothetical protein